MGRYTEETLRKMSEARKRAWQNEEKRKLYLEKMNTDEYKEKQRVSLEKRGNPSKDKKVRMKISESKKGILKSQNVKDIISIRTKICMKREDVKRNLNNRPILYGENNPNWKGGISYEPYCCIWNDKEFKDDIKKRDRYYCQCCGITRYISFKVFECDLNIHHIDYNKKNCNPKNLIAVCRRCNSIANSNRIKWKEFYKEKINAKYTTL